ncbi:hypothetical protein GCM10009554_06480 [Kribbella koreensis]|uniref:Uncharacterized protein n=1 Tax=Kribbella koreensis TaxID=57909 RepID=A0ABN1PE71_9ACTN
MAPQSAPPRRQAISSGVEFCSQLTIQIPRNLRLTIRTPTPSNSNPTTPAPEHPGT